MINGHITAPDTAHSFRTLRQPVYQSTLIFFLQTQREEPPTRRTPLPALRAAFALNGLFVCFLLWLTTVGVMSVGTHFGSMSSCHVPALIFEVILHGLKFHLQNESHDWIQSPVDILRGRCFKTGCCPSNPCWSHLQFVWPGGSLL